MAWLKAGLRRGEEWEGRGRGEVDGKRSVRGEWDGRWEGQGEEVWGGEGRKSF
jgi:hypothetical protein